MQSGIAGEELDTKAAMDIVTSSRSTLKTRTQYAKSKALRMNVRTEGLCGPVDISSKNITTSAHMVPSFFLSGVKATQ
jgi:hypothetical protein